MMLHSQQSTGGVIVIGDGADLMDSLCGAAVLECRIGTIQTLVQRAEKRLATELEPPPVLDMGNIYHRLSAHLWTPTACAERVAGAHALIVALRTNLADAQRRLAAVQQEDIQFDAQKRMADERFVLDGIRVFAHAAE